LTVKKGGLFETVDGYFENLMRSINTYIVRAKCSQVNVTAGVRVYLVNTDAFPPTA
jgi:hypothetical protein